MTGVQTCALPICFPVTIWRGNALFLGTPEDANYIPHIKSMFGGVTTWVYTKPMRFLIELENYCGAKNITRIVSTNTDILSALLAKEGNIKAAPSLSDYQGSVFTYKNLEIVFISPLAQLFTVSYGKFLAERFLSKILAPEKWLPDIPFVWREVNVKEAPAVVDRLARSRLIAVDIETPTAGDWAEARGINCVGYAGLFFGQDGTPIVECFVFPFDEWSYDYIRQINDNSTPKIMQNGLYDNLYFMRWGIPVRAWLWDTYHFFHSWLSELPKDLAIVSAFSVRNIRYWKDDGKTGNLQDYYQYNARDSWATLCAEVCIPCHTDLDSSRWRSRRTVDRISAVFCLASIAR